MSSRHASIASLACLLTLCAHALAGPSVAVAPATPVAYQPMVIDLSTGEVLSEIGVVNPFLERRLNVTMTSPTGRVFVVPGYFAGDGSGPTATSHTGDVFRARFTPDEPGDWTWAVSFRSGADIAVDLDPLGGTGAAGDGLSGAFSVDPHDPDAPGFFAKGRLLWNDAHYLRFQDGTYFVKGGVDSPENWLGYTGFDNTFDGGAGPSTPDGLHAFPTHAADWNPGDPDWDRTDPPGTNDGRAIIGALNYLDSTGVNSIYFLPMNIGGDGKDSWPYVGPIDPAGNPANDNTRFDNSKLAQWDLFFTHAQRLGILLHFVLNEAEAPNKQELDNATLGVERKLFYREMVARFGYHNALNWNICEEYNLNLNLGAPTVIEFAAYLSAVDCYDHPLTVHNAGNPNNPNSGPWAPFVGEADFDLTSLQNAGKTSGWGPVVEAYRTASAASGRRLAVMIDEPGSPTRDFNNDFDAFRKSVIWPILISGGGGEWFINNRDQSLEDFREFDKIWVETGHAVRFFEQHLPFNDMTPDDGVVSGASTTLDGAEALVLIGQLYAVYYPDATNTGSIDLTGEPGPFVVSWYNPRTGAFEGASPTLAGDAIEPMPAPPSDPGEDWVALVQLDGDRDCNDNGIPDSEEIAMGLADDCDGNMIPDDCQPDSDGDGVIDACEADCNDNGIADDDEVSSSGLLASYYPQLEFQRTPLVRIDPVVDFQWGSSGPGSPIPGSLFSSRWTGFLLTGQGGTHTFSTTTNDGTRLFIDGQMIIEAWIQQTATEYTADIDLPANAAVPITFEHFQQGGTATAELRWQPPAGTLEIIPSSSLRPVLDDNDNGVPDVCEHCPGDLTTTGSTSGDPGFGTPDSATDLSDLLFFVNVWNADLGSPSPNPASLADLTTTGANQGDPSFGTPDGDVDLADLLYFVNLWTEGLTVCPG